MAKTLAQHWDGQASAWAAWAAEGRYDSYWSFHGDRFHALIPPPTGRAAALDLACGEGRVGRRLAADGWLVTATDVSFALCEFASARGTTNVVQSSADRLPFADGAFDLAVAFMAFHDFDPGVVTSAFDEVARILTPGGTLMLAVNHPTNSMLRPDRHDDGTVDFTVSHSYFEERPYENVVERDGVSVAFRGIQRPLSTYIGRALGAGLRLEAIDEVSVPAPVSNGRGSADWAKVPMFADMRFRR